MLAGFVFEGFIELGPSPTLTGMATRTTKAKFEGRGDATDRSRSILCHAKHEKEIYYQFEDEPDAPASVEEIVPQAAVPTPDSAPVVAV